MKTPEFFPEEELQGPLKNIQELIQQQIQVDQQLTETDPAYRRIKSEMETIQMQLEQVTQCIALLEAHKKSLEGRRSKKK